MTFSTYQYANFVGQQLTSTSPTTVGTVPGSTQWIVKDITICNSASAAETVTLTIGAVDIFAGMSVPPNSTLHWTGLIVVAAAATIVASASVVTGIWLNIAGQTGQ